MRKLVPMLSALALTFALPIAAQAQGAPRGAIEGAERGGEVGGPAGAAVGAAAGAVVGGAAGLLGVDVRPRFHAFVIRQHHTSFSLERPVAVGVVLPETVQFFDVPAEFGMRLSVHDHQRATGSGGPRRPHRS